MAPIITLTADPTFSDRLLPVVIGAVIALAGAAAVQLWLVPRVETRTRREQRWEDDVLALGQLLTFDHPRIVGELRAELHWLALLAEPPDGADPASEQWAQIKAEHKQSASSARHNFDALRTRVEWLIDRVVSIAPKAEPLAHLATQRRTYFLRHIEFEELEWRPDIPNQPPLTDDHIEATADAMTAIAGEILKSVKELASGAPPRARSWSELATGAVSRAP